MDFLARINFRSHLAVHVVLAVATLLGVVSCGVRGNPEPPLTPAELGRGKPSFTRSSDEFVFPTPTPASAGTKAAGKASGGE